MGRDASCKVEACRALFAVAVLATALLLCLQVSLGAAPVRAAVHPPIPASSLVTGEALLSQAVSSLEKGSEPGRLPMTCIGVVLSSRCEASTSSPDSVSSATFNWTDLSQLPGNPGRWRAEASMAYDAKDGYVVLFGGRQVNLSRPFGSNLMESNDTWMFKQGRWTLLPEAVSPSPRSFASMAYDAKDDYVVLFGGTYQGDVSGTILGDTWVFSRGAWTQLFPGTSPPSRWSPTIAYDSADGEVILFGGGAATGYYLNDTWAFSGGQWTLLSPPVAPPGRVVATMADDPHDNCVLLFGGAVNSTGTQADTWEFASGTWKQVNLSVSPPPRQYAVMAYDTHDSEVVLFGGTYNTLLGDTWIFAGGNWTQESTGAQPAGRIRASMAGDPGDGYVLLFGGTYDFSSLYGDDWSFSGGNWTQLTHDWPQTRALASLTYDAADHYVLLYSGTQLTPGWAYGDTWAYSAGNWTRLSPPNSPPPRWSAAMAYDAGDGYVVLYGGTSYSLGTLADTWRFLHGNWTQLAVSGPPALSDASLTYDTADARLVLFGGLGVNNGYAYPSNETWEFSAGQWTQVAVSVHPAGRYDEGLAYDARDGYVVLFGGWTLYTTSGYPEYFNDTWVFAAGLWSQLYPEPAPLPRGLGVMSYDAAAQMVVLLGGEYGNASFYGPLHDEWVFSGGAWIQMTGGVIPANADSAAMAYSDADASLVLVGSDGDTWIGLGFRVSARASSAVIEIPQNVTLTGIASGGMPPYTYRWDLGDGRNVTGAVVVVAYPSPGNYSLLLTVSDADGSELNASLGLRILPALGILVQVAPVIGDAPLVVHFAVTPSGGLAPFVTAWTFGDGSVTSLSRGNHTYALPGNFHLALDLSDALGVTKSFTVTIAALHPPLMAQANASATSGTVPLTVVFRALVQGGIAPYQYRWQFGDGANSTSANATHTYNAAGLYDVSLNVTDGAGFAVKAALSVTVLATSSPALPVSLGLLIGATVVLIAAVTALLLFWRRRRRGQRPSASLRAPAHR